MNSLSSTEVIEIIERLDGLAWPIQLSEFSAAVSPMGWVNNGHPRMYRTSYVQGMLTVSVIEGSRGEVRTIQGSLIATPMEERRVGDVADAYALIVSDLKKVWGRPRKVRGGVFRFAAWNLPSGGVVMIDVDGASMGGWCQVVEATSSCSKTSRGVR